MSDIKPSNIVMLAKVSTKLNLKSIYELLTIINVDFKISKKNKSRDKIPFFGDENVIIGLRHNSLSRGIRQDGGQVKNLIAVDLQICGKNVHIKISQNNMLMMGLLSPQMGKIASISCLEHIKMVNKRWKHILNLNENIRENSITWLIDCLRLENGKILMYDSSEFLEKLKKIPENVDYKAVRFLSMFTYEHPTVESFLEKIETLKKLDSLCFEKKPKILLRNICNSVYNYQINLNCSLIDLSIALRNKGISAAYDNFTDPSNVHVMIPINSIQHDVNIKKKKNVNIKKNKPNIQAHRFKIGKYGTIKQYSPTEPCIAKDARDLLFKTIYDVLRIN